MRSANRVTFREEDHKVDLRDGKTRTEFEGGFHRKCSDHLVDRDRILRLTVSQTATIIDLLFQIKDEHSHRHQDEMEIRSHEIRLEIDHRQTVAQVVNDGVQMINKTEDVLDNEMTDL